MSSLRSLTFGALSASFLSALLVVPALAQRPASTVQPGAVGSDPSWQPGQPPPKTWIDPDTGHRVFRLTDEPGHRQPLLQPERLHADGKKMVYTTPDGISVLRPRHA